MSGRPTDADVRVERTAASETAGPEPGRADVTVEAPEQHRVAFARLADEQAALRRVATLVARGVPAAELFAAVSEEVGQLLSVDIAGMGRYDADGTLAELTELAAWSRTDHALPRVGSRWAVGGTNVPSLVAQTGHPARIDDHEDASGPMGVDFLGLGIRSAVATPIIVENRLWGVMVVGSTREPPLPTETEERLASFTELVATAIANTESGKRLARLADEQAALRRVATLVAGGVPRDELFAAVTTEVGHLFAVDFAYLARYDLDGAATIVAGWSPTSNRLRVGTRWTLEEKSLLSSISETARPARTDSYTDLPGTVGATSREMGVRSAAGTPIIVEGRPWGAVFVASATDRSLPANTEARLASFTDLVATAIANAESRADLRHIAAEQAALGRVAMLVARGVPADELFSVVAEEVGQMLPADVAYMGRYEPDGTMTLVAAWGTSGGVFPVGTRIALVDGGIGAFVAQTGRTGRMDYPAGERPDAAGAPGRSIRSSIGTRIVVDGHLWGVMLGASFDQLLPSGAEARLASFTDIVATAIASAESRAGLVASRARVVAAADETRRRIERDLHDGAQQRLVSLGLELRATQAALPPDLVEIKGELSRAVEGLASVQEELREMARGIHPAILSEGGLGSALKTLALRSPIPVEVDVPVKTRLPERIEVAAYYVVSETLTNAAKHADASVVRVTVEISERWIRIAVSDDGSGGADPGRGSGLVGLQDRVEALGGTIAVQSPLGAGTSVHVALPLAN